MLQVQRCPGLDEILPWLGTHFMSHGSQLKHFCCSNGSSGIPYRALESFLKTFTGIESFKIDNRSSVLTKRLDIASLTSHYATLKRLKLSYGPSDGTTSSRRTLDAFDVVELVGHCLNLEELFLDFPETAIGILQGDDWGAHGKWIDYLARLSKLQILHIACWPKAPFPDKITTPDPYETAYSALIGLCTHKIQNRIDKRRSSHSLPLKLLSFGDAPSKKDWAPTKYGGQITMSRLFYIRRPAWFHSGHGLSASVAVPARQVRYYVPGFEAVDKATGYDNGSLCKAFNLA